MILVQIETPKNASFNLPIAGPIESEIEVPRSKLGESSATVRRCVGGSEIAVGARRYCLMSCSLRFFAIFYEFLPFRRRLSPT